MVQSPGEFLGSKQNINIFLAQFYTSFQNLTRLRYAPASFISSLSNVIFCGLSGWIQEKICFFFIQVQVLFGATLNGALQ